MIHSIAPEQIKTLRRDEMKVVPLVTGPILRLQQLGQDTMIFKRGCVPHRLAAARDLAQHTPHDFPRPRLGQRIGKMNLIRPSDPANFFFHVLF